MIDLRWLLGFPLIKGATIGVTVVAVVNSHKLSGFAQALIIALVSAVIGALGMVAAAWMNTRSARVMEHELALAREQLRSIQGVTGAVRRADDPVGPSRPVGGTDAH